MKSKSYRCDVEASVADVTDILLKSTVCRPLDARDAVDFVDTMLLSADDRPAPRLDEILPLSANAEAGFVSTVWELSLIHI